MKFPLSILTILILTLPAECAVLDLSVKDNTSGGPAARVIFQIFPGSVDVDYDIMPLLLGNPSSDRKDNDGDGEVDESGEDFAGYATDADGKLRLDLADGFYTLVGFSQEQHFLFVQEVSVPGSVAISAADAVPVEINCRAADGSPIVSAEVFFRPTKRARASVGYTDNSGSLKAYISGGEYHAVLWAAAGKGPHYLILPYQAISPPETAVDFHVAELPTGEVHFDLPRGTPLAIFEVLESTYTREYAEGAEPEIGYDAAYTDFYPIITTEYPYTLSAGIDYNFNMSLAVMFGLGSIYAYELRPALHSIKPGAQRTGITENDSFALHISAERGDKDPVYYPGDTVNLRYYFTDSSGNLLSRILNYSEARLIFPMVTVWNPYKVPIANNFNTESFFRFGLDLSLSTELGEYNVEITLDAGIYGRIAGDFRFYVRPDSDSEPPQITALEVPAEFEAGAELMITAAISDNVGLADVPELRISVDEGTSWTEIPMELANGDLYRAIAPSDLLVLGELNWQITAQDLAGNSVERSGIITILDTSPPVIHHELLTTAELGHELRIQATVQDNVRVEEAVLFYIGTGAEARSIRMSETGEIYSASIPESEITFDGVRYYIRSTDTADNVAFRPGGIDVPEFAHVGVKDTVAPIISHTPVSAGTANIPINIEAIITDNSGMVKATLFYKTIWDKDYLSVNMDSRGEVYSAAIPAEAVVPEGVQYHIIASDGADPDGNIRTSVNPTDGGDYPVAVSSGPHSALARLEISPSAAQETPLDVAAGESVRFTAIGRDEAGGLIPVDVTWAAIGGIGFMDQSGTFLAAGRTTGDSAGRIIATARYADVHGAILQAEAWVRISPGPPAHIILNPSSITLAAGDSQEFFATIVDMYSNPLGEYEARSYEESEQAGSMWYIDWSMDAEEQIGTIDNGIFVGSKVGTGYVVAEVNGNLVISSVTVTPGQLRRIAISSSPPNIEEVVAGDAVQFAATGYDAFGNHISVAPIWSVRGGIGTIRGDGLFRGGAAGGGQVVATVGDVSTAMDIQVVPGQLHSISVSPYVTYVPISTEDHPSTQQFVADGWDAAGNQVPLKKLSWATDLLAGTISLSGLFTAITDPGLRLGEIVTNGTIYAHGTSIAGKQATGLGYVVIQKSPASHLSFISAFVRGASGSSTGVSLATGESVRFEASGRDAEGRSLSINPSWSVEGGIGNISVNGLFTATKPGSGATIATAGGFTGRAEVEVTPGSLKAIAVRPHVLALPPGVQHSLTAVGYDSFENVVPLRGIRWSAGGDAVTIDPAGVSCVVTAAGSGNSIVSVRAGDLVGYSNIFVSSASISLAQNVSHIEQGGEHKVRPYLEIEPDLINVIVGSQQQFTARAIDALGNELDSGSLSWSVAGDIGEIDGSGLLKAASEPSSGRVIVTDGRVFGTAVVTVSDFTTRAQELLIIPSQVSLAAGSMQKFAAFVKVNNTLIPVLPAWRAIGSLGAIDAAGRFMATTVGEGAVEASSGGLSARCDITVSPGMPAQIKIQPNSLSIRAGEQQKFNVVCKDRMGNLVASSPVFQIIGGLGVINGSGLFTAQETGSGSVIAVVEIRHAVSLLSKADIEVLPGDLAEIEVIPEEQEISSGSSIRFSAVGKDAHSNVIPVDPAWDILGSADMGSISSNGLFIADKMGHGQVRAKAGGIIGTASVGVRPADPVFILVKPALISASSQAIDAKQFKATFLDLRGNDTEIFPTVEHAASLSEDVRLSWAVTAGIGSIDPLTGLFVNETDLDEPRTGYVTATAVINAGSKRERTIRGRATVILHPTAKPLATITITPNPATVIKGDTQKFTAVGRNADGVEMEVHPIWSIVSDDGNLEIPNAISADGRFSATSEMEVGSSWRVSASALNNEGQTIHGKAGLNLTTGPLQSVEVVCENDACVGPVESGQTVELEAVGYDQFRNRVGILPDWRVTGEIGIVSPVGGFIPSRTENRAVLAAGRAGSGEVIAEAKGKEGKEHITVIPGQLVSMEVSTDPAPADERLGASEADPLFLGAGSELRFVAIGRDSNLDILGRAKPQNLITVSPTWSVRSSDPAVNLGSISSDGKFVGKDAGVGRIEARVGFVVPHAASLSVISFFHIKVVAGDLASIVLSPSSVSVVSGVGEEQQQFSASGYDPYGNQVADLQPIWHVTGNIGDIVEHAASLFASFTPVPLPSGSPAISGTVVASSGNIQGSASVTVVAALGKLSVISAAVEPPVIQAGDRATCLLRGNDEQGNPIADLSASAQVSVSVPERLGTVTPSTRPNEWTFHADRNLPPEINERSGLLTVTAQIEGITLSAYASLTLVPGPLSKITVEPAESSLSAGSWAEFKAFGYDSWGNLRAVLSPDWVVSPPLGSLVPDTSHPQEVVFAATAAGRGQLIASSQGYEGRADLTVLPGDLKTLMIEPQAATIIAGSSHHFAGIGKDQYGNEIEEIELHWQIMGNTSIGSVTEDGLFSAVKAGNGKLRASYKDASDEANITVVPGSIASATIVIHKEGKELKPPFVLLSGIHYDLHIRGTDLWGNQVSHLEEVAWNVTGDIGLITHSTASNKLAACSTVLTTLFPGRGQIAATVENISTQAEVEVVPHSQNVSSREGAKIRGPFEASINIPPKALRTDEKVSIALSPSPGPAESAERIGHVYSFEPHGIIFAAPAELTLSYSSVTISGINSKGLSLYFWDRFQRKWIRVGGVADPDQKSVTATVNYLSLFTIMQVDPGAYEPSSKNVSIFDVRLSPNTYFAPEINRLTIHYNIGYAPQQPVAVTMNIYDIRGHLIKELLDKSPKYPGWNTDQWDGTDETGEIVKNGRYFLLITAETDGDKVSKVKHLAVFK